MIPFDQRFAPRRPQEFIDHVLVERLQATRVSVGENFRFGHRAAGDTGVLAADGRFETRVVPLVEVDGEIVSSSHIRGAGARPARSSWPRGSWARRSSCAERSCEATSAAATLGFPTANIVPDEALVCPGHGVYAARADGDCAAVSVGVRPTFGTGRAVLVEAYLLDRDVDLYGAVLQDRLPRPAARRAAVRLGRRADRADAARRRADAGAVRLSRSTGPATLSGRMTLTQERKQELVTKFGDGRDRHRQGRGPDRAADRADQRAHRAPAHPPQGPPLAPRAADARRSPPPVPQLPPALRPRALPRADPRARPAQVIAAGDPAPEFTLKRGDGSDFTRADLDGQTTVLVFYPFAFSPVCTDQLNLYEEVLDEFKARGRDAVRRLVRRDLVADRVPGEARRDDRAAVGLRAQGRGVPRLRRLPPGRLPAARAGDRRPRRRRQVELPGRRRPAICPGANLIFDGLARAVAAGAGW